jgi:hypothetical protein
MGGEVERVGLVEMGDEVERVGLVEMGGKLERWVAKLRDGLS